MVCEGGDRLMIHHRQGPFCLRHKWIGAATPVLTDEPQTRKQQTLQSNSLSVPLCGLTKERAEQENIGS